MSLLSASGVTVTVEGRHLVQQASLRVNAGEVVAIIGPNGAGKTSLVRAITGDLPISSGDILFNNMPVSQFSLQQKAKHIAILTQHTELNFPFPVEEVVHLGRIPHASGKQQDQRIVEAALQAVDMQERRQQLYTQLSGGEKQRVQLARVMAQVWRREDTQHRLLILDEPTSSLDVSHTRQLMRVIRELAATGMGVIMILHDFNLAARFADHIVAMVDGEKVVEGRPDRVLTTENMAQYFQVDSHIIAHPKTGRPMVFFDD